MRLRNHEVHAFFGKRGSGKSTRAKELLRELQASRQRHVVFDYHDEYSVQGQASKEVRLGPVRERIDCAELATLLADGSDILDRSDLSLSVVPSREPEECAECFRDLVVFIRNTGNLVFVADEVGVYGPLVEKELNYLATQSRHDKVPLVFVAQRAVQIPKTARTQISRLNSGRQDDPADIRALSEIMGEDLAQKVRELGAGESVDWRDTWGPRKPPQSNPPERKHAT